MNGFDFIEENEEDDFENYMKKFLDLEDLPSFDIEDEDEKWKWKMTLLSWKDFAILVFYKPNQTFFFIEIPNHILNKIPKIDILTNLWQTYEIPIKNLWKNHHRLKSQTLRKKNKNKNLDFNILIIYEDFFIDF